MEFPAFPPLVLRCSSGRRWAYAPKADCYVAIAPMLHTGLTEYFIAEQLAAAEGSAEGVGRYGQNECEYDVGVAGVPG